jgi:hypothetical protein
VFPRDKNLLMEYKCFVKSQRFNHEIKKVLPKDKGLIMKLKKIARK